jgi:predicted nucleic acid-binding protein
VAISSVTLAEIEHGIQRRGPPKALRNALTQVLLHMDVWPWDAAAAHAVALKLEVW